MTLDPKSDNTSQQQIARRERPQIAMGQRGLEIENFEQAIRFAQGLIDGGMVPKGTRSPGAVVGLIEAGKELGLAPMYALSNLTFTNGRLGIMGDAAKALIRASGMLEPGTDFEETYTGEEYTLDWKCTVSAHRKGQPKRFEREFSLRDATTARLIRLNGKVVQTYSRDGGWGEHGGPWSAYTKRMLMYRALGFLVRDYFADVLGGLAVTEELRDYTSGGDGDGAAKASASNTPEPDPLLASAPVAVTTIEAIEVGGVTVLGPEARRVERPEPPADVIDVPSAEEQAEPAAPAAAPAEKTRTTKRRGGTKPSAPPTEPSAEEVELVRAVERLENAIVSAETVESANRAWTEAQPILDRLAPAEQQRLTKLYRQNVAGLNGVAR